MVDRHPTVSNDLLSNDLFCVHPVLCASGRKGSSLHRRGRPGGLWPGQTL